MITKKMNEAEIIKRVIGGDSAIFRTLVLRHQSLIFTVCLKMLQDREEAEDVAQEVFVQAYRSLSDYNGEAQFTTWLYKIAANKCIDLRRKRARRASIASITPLQEDSPSRSVDPTPEEEIIISERKEEIHEIVNRLPEKYRDVIILYHFKRLRYKEIAEILNIEVKTVETRMSRAKKQLRAVLRKEDFVP